MKLSVSSRDTYGRCQRQFWHHTNKTPVDSDWKAPLYFMFGSAAHECLEVCGYNGSKMLVSKCKEICLKHGITDPFDQVRVMVAVRSYFAAWPDSDVIAVEVDFESEFVKGRIDGLIRESDGIYILENKFKSQIPGGIGIELTSDMQLCAYASERKNLAAKLCLQEEEFKGVLWRGVVKNSQKVDQGRVYADGRVKHPETPEAFLARCSNGRTMAWRAQFDELSVDLSSQELSFLAFEIDGKKNDIHLFEKNEQSCVMNASCGIGCKYYSKCHGWLYSEVTEKTKETDELW